MCNELYYEKFTKDIAEVSLIYLFFEKPLFQTPKAQKKCVVRKKRKIFWQKKLAKHQFGLGSLGDASEMAYSKHCITIRFTDVLFSLAISSSLLIISLGRRNVLELYSLYFSFSNTSISHLINHILTLFYNSTINFYTLETKL